jgi:hypothetical protein
MAEEGSGLLSPARNESIFRTDILHDYLPDNMGRAERPCLILLGGQPGAGKTAVLAASQNELARSGPTIRIVGDDLRSYHPEFLAFQRQDPETASRYTQMDAGLWTEKLLAAATERQVNVVLETTMRTPENVAYAVEVRAVAVNPRLSWQGAHHRFEEMLHAGLAARIPPQQVHDAAVDGLRLSLEKLESEGLADQVQLRTRGGAVLYENEFRTALGRDHPRRAALQEQQSRPLTLVELQRFAEDWRHVLSRMADRRAPAEEVASVEARAAGDVAILLAQRRAADGVQGQRRVLTAGRELVEEQKTVSELKDDEAQRHRRMRGISDHDHKFIPELNSLAGSRHTHGSDKALVPARHLSDLSEGEMDKRLQQSARLVDKREEIENLARIVFGNSQAGLTDKVRDTASGSGAADDVHMGRLGDLAGEGGTWLRRSSPERKAAEIHAPMLAAALADFGLAVVYERHRVVTEHREDQARQRVGVPQPSAALSAALAATGDERRNRLEGNQRLKRELEQLSLAMTKRFSAVIRRISGEANSTLPRVLRSRG